MAVLFLVGHLPWLGRTLEDLDSVNFVLGVRDFDVASHQPHPPGYPAIIAMGKVGTTLARLVPTAGAEAPTVPEALALSFWAAVFGAIAAWPLVQLFRALGGRNDLAYAATALTMASPLFWFNAARPMSDVVGLSVALVSQALAATAFARQQEARLAARTAERPIDVAALVSSGRRIVLAALVAGLAIGFRSQTALLTLPLLVIVVADRTGAGAGGTLLGATMAFALGVTAWSVPFLVAAGGPWAFLNALAGQAGEDFAGVEMLATTFSVRRLAFALLDTFITPWSVPGLGVVIALLAAVGAVVGLIRSWRATLVIACLLVPYLAFHLAFQESWTTRYALPIVPAVAWLAVRGLAVAGHLAVAAGTGAIVVASLAVTMPALVAYARQGSPLARAEAEVSRAARGAAPAIGMHQGVRLALRGEPIANAALPSPPRHEWMSLVDYWKGGGVGPVWFLAETRRTDLALIDPASRRTRGAYRWPLDPSGFVGGCRPSEIDWVEVRQPGWFAERGWALTPEVAGVSRLDGKGPAQGGITARVRRHPGPTVLMVGGRNLGPEGSADVRFEVSVDDRALAATTVPPAPGFFLEMVALPAGALHGEGPYATLTIRAAATDGSTAPVEAAIEQFDVQPAEAIVYGYDRGWHEAEYTLSSGRVWRWTSDRATLRVHAPGRAIVVQMHGESPLRYFDSAPEVVLRAGEIELGRWRPDDDFSIRVKISGSIVEQARGLVTLTTTQTFVPAERGGGTDRRHLGLRIFDVTVSDAAAGNR